MDGANLLERAFIFSWESILGRPGSTLSRIKRTIPSIPSFPSLASADKRGLALGHVSTFLHKFETTSLGPFLALFPADVKRGGTGEVR